MSLLSKAQGVAREQLVEHYVRFEPVVERILADVPPRGAAKEHPNFVNDGSRAQVFADQVGGVQFAFRIPKNPVEFGSDRRRQEFLDGYVDPLVRVMGSRGVEQIVACTSERAPVPVVVSKLVPDSEPYNRRASRGGVWLRASCVEEFLDAQLEMSERHVSRDKGSAANILVDGGGVFTCVDPIVAYYDSRRTVEATVPEMLTTLKTSRPRGSSFVPAEQFAEVQAIAHNFALRFPNSYRNDDVQALAAGFRVEE